MTLPGGWAEATIEDITSYVSRGKSPKYVEKSQFAVVNQRAVRWSGVDPQHLKFVDPDTSDQWSEDRTLRAGDVLWNSTGTGTIGRAAVYQPLSGFNRVVADSHVTILRTIDAFSSHFLCALIRSPAIQTVIGEMQNGSTNQVELSRTAILRTFVPFPPLEEQKRIVAKLDDLSLRLGRAGLELDRVSVLARSLRERAVRLAFRGGLTAEWRANNIPCNRSTYADLPTGWRWTSLGEVANIKAGLTLGKKRSSTAMLVDVPYLRVANVQRGSLNLSAIKQVSITEAEADSLRLEPGDILLNEGGDRDKLGRGWVWEGQIPGCIHQNHVFRARLRDLQNSPFYVSLYANEFGQRYFMEHGTQTTNLASISKSKISKLPIPLASPAEQREIVSRLNAIFVSADRLEAEATRARALLDRLESGILGKAFRGDLVEQDPKDEPASVLLERIRAERGAAPKPKRGRRATAAD